MERRIRPDTHTARLRRQAANVAHRVINEARFGAIRYLPQVGQAVDSLLDSLEYNHAAWLALGQLRNCDRDSFDHSVAVGTFAVAFAHAMRLPRDEARAIGTGALLHDIGKTQIPGWILNKPGRLTDNERTQMYSHVACGVEMLKTIDGISETILGAVAEHHERIDGKGYPRHLQGAHISLAGQITSICDCYEALTAKRCYRRGEPPAAALGRMFEWAGSRFDRLLLHRFITSIGIYPAGALVRLASQRLGVVVDAGPELLSPRVRVIYDIGRDSYLPPAEIVATIRDGDRVIGFETPESWGIQPHLFMSSAPAVVAHATG